MTLEIWLAVDAPELAMGYVPAYVRAVLQRGDQRPAYAVLDRHEWPVTLSSAHKIKPGKTAWLQWQELANTEPHVEITPLKVLFEDGTTWEREK